MVQGLLRNPQLQDFDPPLGLHPAQAQAVEADGLAGLPSTSLRCMAAVIRAGRHSLEGILTAPFNRKYRLANGFCGWLGINAGRNPIQNLIVPNPRFLSKRLFHKEYNMELNVPAIMAAECGMTAVGVA